MSLRGRLRDGGVRDVAYLARAVGFVVGISVEMRDNLDAKDEHRKNQRYSQQA
jgi:hypothetical protein